MTLNFLSGKADIRAVQLNQEFFQEILFDILPNLVIGKNSISSIVVDIPVKNLEKTPIVVHIKSIFLEITEPEALSKKQNSFLRKHSIRAQDLSVLREAMSEKEKEKLIKQQKKDEEKRRKKEAEQLKKLIKKKEEKLKKQKKDEEKKKKAALIPKKIQKKGLGDFVKDGISVDIDEIQVTLATRGENKASPPEERPPQLYLEITSFKMRQTDQNFMVGAKLADNGQTNEFVHRTFTFTMQASTGHLSKEKFPLIGNTNVQVYLTVSYEDAVECTIEIPELTFHMDLLNMSTLIQAILGLVACFNRADLKKIEAEKKNENNQNTEQSAQDKMVHPPLIVNLKIGKLKGNLLGFSTELQDVIFSKISPPNSPAWESVFQLQIASLLLDQQKTRIISCPAHPFQKPIPLLCTTIKHEAYAFFALNSNNPPPSLSKNSFNSFLQSAAADGFLQMKALVRFPTPPPPTQKAMIELNVNPISLKLPSDDTILATILKIVGLVVKTPFAHKPLPSTVKARASVRSFAAPKQEIMKNPFFTFSLNVQKLTCELDNTELAIPRPLTLQVFGNEKTTVSEINATLISFGTYFKIQDLQLITQEKNGRLNVSILASQISTDSILDLLEQDFIWKNIEAGLEIAETVKDYSRKVKILAESLTTGPPLTFGDCNVHVHDLLVEKDLLHPSAVKLIKVKDSSNLSFTFNKQQIAFEIAQAQMRLSEFLLEDRQQRFFFELAKRIVKFIDRLKLVKKKVALHQIRQLVAPQYPELFEEIENLYYFANLINK